MKIIERDLRQLVDEIRQEWKLMWHSRVDDKVRAEGIADKTYKLLFVDRGLILFATRSFKPPEFQEILEMHLTPQEIERVTSSPIKGGIRKFIKEYITVGSKPETLRTEETRSELENMKIHQPRKHGGRGWLHLPSPGLNEKKPRTPRR